MKIAVTADLHLKSGDQQREEAFRHILAKLSEQGIKVLLVAGDFLDQSFGGYVEADRVAKEYPENRILVIPGNHDPKLMGRFTVENLEVISEPELRVLNDRQFLFIPYEEGKTMGELIEPLAAPEELEKGRFVLVSHGDFGGYRLKESGGEAGYFPLTRSDLLEYEPASVLLGHIHVPSAITSDVLYPGSPYPIDESEEGERRILIYDTVTGTVDSLWLDYGPVYYSVDLFVVPDGKELAQVQKQVRESIGAHLRSTPSGEAVCSRLRVRIFLRGFTTSREGMVETAKQAVEDLGAVCISAEAGKLEVSSDENLSTIASKVRDKIEEIALDYPEEDELKKLVLQHAYEIIYRR